MWTLRNLVQHIVKSTQMECRYFGNIVIGPFFFDNPLNCSIIKNTTKYFTNTTWNCIGIYWAAARTPLYNMVTGSKDIRTMCPISWLLGLTFCLFFSLACYNRHRLHNSFITVKTVKKCEVTYKKMTDDVT